MQLLLNLDYPDKSDLRYRIINFPDGHNHLVFDDLIGNSHVHIKCRIRSFEEMFLLLQSVDVMRHNQNTFDIEIAYLLAARCDRYFSQGDAFDLKIVCEILNSIHAPITVIKPHSIVTSHLINNIRTKDFSKEMCAMLLHDNICLIAPDKGASAWVREIADELGIERIECSKERDVTTGKLSNPKVNGNVKDKNCVILDDLCDGGGTFIQLGNELKSLGASKLYLVVTHAIFSNQSNLNTMKELFDNIYCTNSYKDISDEQITQIKVI